ncbi:MAG: YihY/virulence factor BrkB family protein [Pseudomonadota bacterium]|nr:YihY/virulence factor BrkB family protein [Pseudomonadota bacterium]
MNPQKIIHQAHTLLQSFVKTVTLHIGSIAGAIGKDFITGNIPLRATSLVYTTILSIVPLLALSFSVLKSFGVHNQLAPILQNVLAPLGAKGAEVTQSILMFVDNIKVGVLGAIGLGFLLYTVISLIQKIEAAFNEIWHVDKARPHIQRFTSYLSVITLGPIVLFSIIGLKTKFTTNPMVAEYLGVATSTGFMPSLIETISAVALPIALFTFMNKTIPNTNVKLLPALVAGIVTTFLWQATAKGFGTFMANSGNYDAIYSSFAIILLVFIWLYLNWLIILIGGSLCFYIQNPEQSKLSLRSASLHPQDRLYHALVTLKEVAQKFEDGQKPLTANQLGKLLGSHVFAISTLEALSSNNLIHFDESGKQEIMLTKSIDKIYLYDLMEALGHNTARIANKKPKHKKVFSALECLENDWKKKPVKDFM